MTYYKSEDALRAIQAVNNIFIDGRTLKASLGTTKYCSHFMKNQTCPKHDCMYLHELGKLRGFYEGKLIRPRYWRRFSTLTGDEAASFTKEEMQQGKHTEYEKRLHEEMALETNLETTERSNGVSEKGKSRSPSPKAAWPNLDKSNNSFQNSYAERLDHLPPSLIVLRTVRYEDFFLAFAFTGMDRIRKGVRRATRTRDRVSVAQTASPQCRQIHIR